MRLQRGMIVGLGLRLALGFPHGLVPRLCAQTVSSSSVFAPLQHGGTLVVWWIEPTTAAQRAQATLEKIVPSVPRIPLDQRAASELGQSASTFGANAGDTGQTASSYGTNASNAGQSASSYGTAASNLGRNASDTGQTASSYGQTASSYGQSASNYGQSASNYGQTPRGDALPNALTAHQRELASTLQSSFAGLNLRLIAVPDIQLKARLAAAQNTGTYPDVVVADGPLPPEWRALAASAGVITLGEMATRLPQEVDDPAVSQTQHAEAAILLRAPHPEAARAYVTWLREGHIVLPQPPLDADSATVADVAVRAATAALSGSAIPNADPEITAKTAWEPASTINDRELLVGAASPFKLDVLSVTVVGARFAVVELRAVSGSRTSFGVAYPLLVLRRVDGVSWKVLQISLDLPETQAGHAQALLLQYSAGQPAEQLTAATGLQPRDGDTRAPQPELGWQQGATGKLFVVEWQQAGKLASVPSNLFFVPNEGMRSQTRVNAQFAQASEAYRWRVWTVGAGGVLKLSAWQTFTVVGR